MPTTNYDVYVSNATLIATIAEYVDDNDMSESEFFKQAATERLKREGYLDNGGD